mmetsp:Transcript_14480/g.25657  ORF Transcript_14480/g.25657 Transcript_14480/m.25657 type:complete len:208 (-) Transcript_14480:2252-2875(-)
MLYPSRKHSVQAQFRLVHSIVSAISGHAYVLFRSPQWKHMGASGCLQGTSMCSLFRSSRWSRVISSVPHSSHCASSLTKKLRTSAHLSTDLSSLRIRVTVSWSIASISSMFSGPRSADRDDSETCLWPLSESLETLLETLLSALSRWRTAWMVGRLAGSAFQHSRMRSVVSLPTSWSLRPGRTPSRVNLAVTRYQSLGVMLRSASSS